MADDDGLLLGRHTPVVEAYDPGLLYPIPRATGRDRLPAAALPMHGVDVWHAYELSWLDWAGRPAVRLGRIGVPATSPNIVESKSLKLYLNSLNFARHGADGEARSTIAADLSAVAGAAVDVELYRLDHPAMAGITLTGECLDDLPLQAPDGPPSADLLRAGGEIVEERLYSHLLRSLCPVTAQPDWASVWFHYRGPAIARESLLAYIVAFRQHGEFHEQCVERMFTDLSIACTPEFLTVQALYTRRGGLDICPLRSSDPVAVPLGRLSRQ